MRVLHVSPTWFGTTSVIGGGERYPYELARSMAARADVALVTYATDSGTSREGALTVDRLPPGRLVRWHPLAASPVRWRLLRWVRWADVVHVHQVATLTTGGAIVLARLWGKPVFVTDLGGGHPHAPSSRLPLLRLAEAMLLLSQYSRDLWSAVPRRERPERLEVIYGGVDPERFAPGSTRTTGKVLYVGRLLPHKGLEYLIEAIDNPFRLTVVGPAPRADYLARLRRRAAGKAVTFTGAVSDEVLLEHYRTAIATVLPSVFVTSDGARSVVPELLGLVALESMACGTPVIVTNVASLPEIVENNQTGFVVPANSADAIRDRLCHLAARPDEVERMGRQGRDCILQRFTWNATVDRCLDHYTAATDRRRCHQPGTP